MLEAALVLSVAPTQPWAAAQAPSGLVELIPVISCTCLSTTNHCYSPLFNTTDLVVQQSDNSRCPVCHRACKKARLPDICKSPESYQLGVPGIETELVTLLLLFIGRYVVQSCGFICAILLSAKLDFSTCQWVDTLWRPGSGNCPLVYIHGSEKLVVREGTVSCQLPCLIYCRLFRRVSGCLIPHVLTAASCLHIPLVTTQPLQQLCCMRTPVDQLSVFVAH